mgnify:CR=1 FL=1
MIGKYAEIPKVELSTEIKRKDYGTLKVSKEAGLFWKSEKYSQAG